jgi:hypothetical protein
MPQRLTAAGIRAAAAEHELDPRALRAVITVESGGSGFLRNGWCKILFEAHHLWQRLKTRDIDPGRLGAQRPDLCRRKWNAHLYVGGAGEWDRVAAVLAWASRNDPDHWESYKKAAYESCSWGLFQLMGFNYAAAGYADVYQMKHDHEAGEPQQLAAILRWMEHDGLLPLLRAKSWSAFARRYNGPGQVTLYAGRLRDAYHAAPV